MVGSDIRNIMKRISPPEWESRELNWWLDGHWVAYSWVVDSLLLSSLLIGGVDIGGDGAGADDVSDILLQCDPKSLGINSITTMPL